jgi:hypothetical protein
MQDQGCQIVYFQTKKSTNLSKFCRKMLVLYMVIWNILRPVVIHILWPFGNVVVIRYNFPHIGILCQEKYGNPVSKTDF